VSVQGASLNIHEDERVKSKKWLNNLLEEEANQYNSENPFDPLTDPSVGCIEIVLSLTNWYHLYRRRYPPKDEVDIQDDLPQGYAVFDWESILHGNAGKLGEYKKPEVPLDKISCYLYEFHIDSYASHSLPPLQWT
jgi:hypothetical protein